MQSHKPQVNVEFTKLTINETKLNEYTKKKQTNFG